MNSYKIALIQRSILSALGLSQTRFDGKIKLIDTDSQRVH